MPPRPHALLPVVAASHLDNVPTAQDTNRIATRGLAQALSLSWKEVALIKVRLWVEALAEVWTAEVDGATGLVAWEAEAGVQRVLDQVKAVVELRRHVLGAHVWVVARWVREDRGEEGVHKWENVTVGVAGVVDVGKGLDVC